MNTTQPTRIQETINDSRQWGRDIGLTGPDGRGTLLSQHKKLTEESAELLAEINLGDTDAASIELGDCVITLIQLATKLGVPFERCVELAHLKNINRTGGMVGDTYVKHTTTTTTNH